MYRYSVYNSVNNISVNVINVRIALIIIATKPNEVRLYSTAVLLFYSRAFAFRSDSDPPTLAVTIQ